MLIEQEGRGTALRRWGGVQHYGGGEGYSSTVRRRGYAWQSRLLHYMVIHTQNCGLLDTMAHCCACVSAKLLRRFELNSVSKRWTGNVSPPEPLRFF